MGSISTQCVLLCIWVSQVSLLSRFTCFGHLPVLVRRSTRSYYPRKPRDFPSATPFRPTFVHLSQHLVSISLRTSSYLRKMPLFHLKKLQPKFWQRLRQRTKPQINPQTNGGAPAGSAADTTTSNEGIGTSSGVTLDQRTLPSLQTARVLAANVPNAYRTSSPTYVSGGIPRGVSQSVARPTVSIDGGWRASATNTPNVNDHLHSYLPHETQERESSISGGVIAGSNRQLRAMQRVTTVPQEYQRLNGLFLDWHRLFELPLRNQCHHATILFFFFSPPSLKTERLPTWERWPTWERLSDL
ncbi:hypothetical protein SCHPADRAFT_1002595 [Schizopora paradoxa]|uniref:Uncharacterized protein n=1 Tax=Schizopora paradoxa TaxID=27342 RepID=A0A0H2R953_9AGAM|nr:hypothetical protein SCHPADRAFT_1002595 [Schizopora paradoxa]